MREGQASRMAKKLQEDDERRKRYEESKKKAEIKETK
jgi:hypothetical protein